jgi:hypothetical protein
MAKFRTRKKYNKKAAPPQVTSREIRDISASTTDYLKRWTSRELHKIQQEQKSPLCIPLNNGYKIGLYQLTVYPNKTCDVLDPNKDLMHTFDNKISAILFAIYTIKKQYYIADDLLLWDKEINKNYIEMINYRRIIESARRRSDFVTVDTRMPRLEMAETRLNLARDKISKIHKTAKYYKIWE